MKEHNKHTHKDAGEKDIDKAMRVNGRNCEHEEMQEKHTEVNEAEPNQANEQSAIKELNAGLEQLDRLVAEQEPNLSFFLEQVKETQAKSRKRLFRDLSIFWGIAIAMLAIWTATYFHSPMIFLTLQALATVTLPIIVYFLMKKEVKDTL